MHALESTTRHHLERYLAGHESLDQLTTWIVEAMWRTDPDQGDAATDFVYAVQLALAELSDGVRSRDELRSELQALMEKEIVQRAAATG